MINSMTGFGRAQELIHGRDITVEIRSVNHRFFEFSARVPRCYGYLEEKLKTFIQKEITRGKVEASVLINAVDVGNTEVVINVPLAQEYLNALRDMGQQLGVADDITVSRLARFGDIFTVRKTADDEEEIWNDVSAVAKEALERFIAMRAAEGARLREDICGKLDNIITLVEKVEEASPETVKQYRERLTAKITDLLAGAAVDSQRILTEAAIVAERLAVDEETVRLRSHIAQFREILSGENAAGRKLDFLVQEINREANTIGSKCQDARIAQVVVDIKGEIEKIREQIQNLE